MESILKKHSAKLYQKDQLLKWDLPEPAKAQIQNENAPYYFLSCTKNEEGAVSKYNLTLFPSQTPSVFGLEVRMRKIQPEVLHATLTMLREKGGQILVSTGICVQETLCLFGIYFSITQEIKKLEIEQSIKKLTNVLGIDMFHYTVSGCEMV